MQSNVKLIPPRKENRPTANLWEFNIFFSPVCGIVPVCETGPVCGTGQVCESYMFCSDRKTFVYHVTMLIFV